jgi:hypothetical protein
MNCLSTEKRVQVVSALIEGNSVRATVRMTGVCKDTVLKLLVDLGSACRSYHNGHVRNIRPRYVQCLHSLLKTLVSYQSTGFVSGHRFSDAASRLKSVAPLEAARRNSTFSANCSARQRGRRAPGNLPLLSRLCAYRFSITFLIRSKAQSISSRVMTRGGAIRITRSCVSLQSRPSSFSASQ